MILLATCAFLNAAARETQASGSRPKEVVPVRCVSERVQSMMQLPPPHPLQSTAGPKFTSRRYRLKSVLEETHRRFMEETDLGPAPLPGQLSPLVRTALLEYLPPMSPPLRC
jgi:hypothetical protein